LFDLILHKIGKYSYIELIQAFLKQKIQMVFNMDLKMIMFEALVVGVVIWGLLTGHLRLDQLINIAVQSVVIGFVLWVIVTGRVPEVLAIFASQYPG